MKTVDQNKITFFDLSGSFGPQIDGHAGFYGCKPRPPNAQHLCKTDPIGELTELIALDVKGGGVVNVGGNIQSKGTSGEQCGKTCFGGTLDPTTLNAFVSIKGSFYFISIAVNFSIPPIEIFPGTNFGNTCD